MKFWKGNRLDQEFEKHPKDVMRGFIKSQQYKDWLEGCNFDRSLRIYLTSKDGLFSTFDNDEYDKLADYILKNHETESKAMKVFSFIK